MRIWKIEFLKAPESDEMWLSRLIQAQDFAAAVTKANTLLAKVKQKYPNAEIMGLEFSQEIEPE